MYSVVNMEKLKYEEEGILLTKCKYRPFTMIGSMYCKDGCPFFETMDVEDKVVYCKFKEMVK